MRDRRFKMFQLLVASLCLGTSGCSEAWRAYWEARDHHHPDEPSFDAGSPAGDAGETSCGSRGLPECPEGQFCDFPESSSCGDTDRPGTCRDQPQICTTIFAPVCGCDGTTYASACTAAAAGVSVRSEGECEQACGGLLGLACDEGEYCNYAPDAICGRADATGTCAPMPQACTREYRPVCGCDGQTYGNACTAAAAGVSVETEGECAAAPQVCGGLLGVSCPNGQYCDYAAGDGCDVADGQGRCASTPEFCTDIYAPVCSCDGTTYGNACEAARAGASVRKTGEC